MSDNTSTKIDTSFLLKEDMSDDEKLKIQKEFIDYIKNTILTQHYDLNTLKEIDYNEDLLVNILTTKWFTDLRISKWELTLEYFWWEEKVKMNWFSFEQLYEDLNNIVKKTWFNNVVEWKYFSFHIPLIHEWKIFYQWFRWVLKTSIDWNEMTIRKLTTPRKLKDFIFDDILIKCVLDWLLSRKWLVISWKTGSWKSTILISLLNYFNQNDFSTILLEECWSVFRRFIKKLRTVNNNQWKTKDTTYDEIIRYLENIYRSLENYDMIINDIEFALDAWKKYIYMKYSKRWEIIPRIKLFKILEMYYKSSSVERVKETWKIVLKILELHKNEIEDWIKKIENTEFMQSVKKFTLSRQRNIVTLEEPIEFIYWKWWILRFFQHSLSQHFHWQYEEFINQILRDNPNICYVAEVRNQEEIDTFLTSMSIWITSMTTCHSYDSIEVLLKFIDLSKKWSWEVMNILTNSFNSWINIESYYFFSLKDVQSLVNWFIQWYDYLNFSDQRITIMFRNYYLKNELSQFSQQMKNWYTTWDNKLLYYPKKYTLNYRLMLLIEEIKSKEKELKEKWFNFDIFFEEMCDLLYNTWSFIEMWDLVLFEMVYWKEIKDKMQIHLHELEQYEVYNSKKQLFKLK